VQSETVLRLRPPRHRVSRKAIGYWTVRAVPGWLILTAAQVIWLLNDDGNRAWHVAGFVATAVLAAAHLIVMPQWRYRVHLWETTDEAVYMRSGWLNQESRIAPVSRIQTVDSERGPIEQLFRLANVTVTTASAAGPIKIHGLDRATADRLVDELTANTQATRGDAT
jgi:membrane protein YdbS with pleckstrin-like domain